MRGLPGVELMAELALAGVGHRTLLRSGDDVEIAVDLAVAECALELDAKRRSAERQALAADIGNVVGRHVSNALLQIARAFRG